MHIPLLIPAISACVHFVHTCVCACEQAREQSECAQLLVLALMYCTSPSPLCVRKVALQFLACLLEAVAEHPLPVSPLPVKKNLYKSAAILMVSLSCVDVVGWMKFSCRKFLYDFSLIFLTIYWILEI